MQILRRNPEMATQCAERSNPSRPYNGDPLSRLEIYADAFLDVLGNDAEVKKLVDTDAHEGPVYVKAKNAVYFTTVPVNVKVPIEGYRNVLIRRLTLDNLDDDPRGNQ